VNYETVIPFYIARYEKELSEEGNIENEVKDLEYFRNEMMRRFWNGCRKS
jgi:hypothetical protein